MGVCLLLPETLDPSLSSDLRWQEENSVIAKGSFTLEGKQKRHRFQMVS